MTMTTTHKAIRMNQLSNHERGELAVDEVIKAQLKSLARLSPEDAVREAANRRLLTFTSRRRKTATA